MTFKIARTPTFKAKVEVHMANDKGGVDKSTFMAEYYRADTDELDELRRLKAREVLERKLAGWSELVDENNQTVEFNESTRAAVYKIPEALIAMSETFWANVVVAREKNSNR